MKIYRYSFEPGETRSINATGRFLRGLTAKKRYQVQFDNSAMTEFETGIAYEATEPFSQVRITNSADVAQIIEVAIADGFVDDNRLVGQIDLNGAIGVITDAARVVNYHPKQTIAGATEVLPLNDTRRAATVQCSGPVYVENTDGITVQNLTWEATGALTLIPVSGSVEVRILEEEN